MFPQCSPVIGCKLVYGQANILPCREETSVECNVLTQLPIVR